MSNSRRIGVVLVALVVAVAAFFALRPDTTAQQQDEASQREQNGGSGEQEAGTSGTGSAENGTTTEAAPAREPQYEEIRIEDGGPAGSARTVSFDSGDQVRLAFRSDAAGEVHIHGYDRYVQLRAGRTSRVRFPADSEGSFEIENHANGELLARLEVEP